MSDRGCSGKRGENSSQGVNGYLSEEFSLSPVALLTGWSGDSFSPPACWPSVSAGEREPVSSVANHNG